MGTFVQRAAGRSLVYQGALAPSFKPPAEPVYGVVLLDGRGCLVGAGAAASLPGEVEMPPGVDLRTQDLRGYLSEERRYLGGRRFPLVSATWVSVKSRRVRWGSTWSPASATSAPTCWSPTWGPSLRS